MKKRLVDRAMAGSIGFGVMAVITAVSPTLTVLADDADASADPGTVSDSGTPADSGAASGSGMPADSGAASGSETPADSGAASDSGTPADSGAASGSGAAADSGAMGENNGSQSAEVEVGTALDHAQTAVDKAVGTLPPYTASTEEQNEIREDLRDAKEAVNEIQDSVEELGIRNQEASEAKEGLNDIVKDDEQETMGTMAENVSQAKDAAESAANVTGAAASEAELAAGEAERAQEAVYESSAAAQEAKDQAQAEAARAQAALKTAENADAAAQEKVDNAKASLDALTAQKEAADKAFADAQAKVAAAQEKLDEILKDADGSAAKAREQAEEAFLKAQDEFLKAQNKLAETEKNVEKAQGELSAAQAVLDVKTKELEEAAKAYEAADLAYDEAAVKLREAKEKEAGCQSLRDDTAKILSEANQMLMDLATEQKVLTEKEPQAEAEAEEAEAAAGMAEAAIGMAAQKYNAAFDMLAGILITQKNEELWEAGDWRVDEEGQKYSSAFYKPGNYDFVERYFTYEIGGTGWVTVYEKAPVYQGGGGRRFTVIFADDMPKFYWLNEEEIGDPIGATSVQITETGYVVHGEEYHFTEEFAEKGKREYVIERTGHKEDEDYDQARKAAKEASKAKLEAEHAAKAAREEAAQKKAEWERIQKRLEELPEQKEAAQAAYEAAQQDFWKAEEHLTAAKGETAGYQAARDTASNNFLLSGLALGAARDVQMNQADAVKALQAVLDAANATKGTAERNSLLAQGIEQVAREARDKVVDALMALQILTSEGEVGDDTYRTLVENYDRAVLTYQAALAAKGVSEQNLAQVRIAAERARAAADANFAYRVPSVADSATGGGSGTGEAGRGSGTGGSGGGGIGNATVAAVELQAAPAAVLPEAATPLAGRIEADLQEDEAPTELFENLDEEAVPLAGPGSESLDMLKLGDFSIPPVGYAEGRLMFWWWLLIITLFGAAGAEMYRRYQKKQVESQEAEK